MDAPHFLGLYQLTQGNTTATDFSRFASLQNQRSYSISFIWLHFSLVVSISYCEVWMDITGSNNRLMLSLSLSHRRTLNAYAKFNFPLTQSKHIFHLIHRTKYSHPLYADIANDALLSSFYYTYFSVVKWNDQIDACRAFTQLLVYSSLINR